MLVRRHRPFALVVARLITFAAVPELSASTSAAPYLTSRHRVHDFRPRSRGRAGGSSASGGTGILLCSSLLIDDASCRLTIVTVRAEEWWCDWRTGGVEKRCPEKPRRR